MYLLADFTQIRALKKSNNKEISVRFPSNGVTRGSKESVNGCQESLPYKQLQKEVKRLEGLLDEVKVFNPYIEIEVETFIEKKSHKKMLAQASTYFPCTILIL